MRRIMEKEHPACPQCGYDLHGIPEIRCPECGFRFDKAALRGLAEEAEHCRLTAARTVVVRTALALVLGMPFLCAIAGLRGSVLLVVLGIAYLAAFAVWGAGRTGRLLVRALEAEAARPTFFVDIDPHKRAARGRVVLAPEEGLARVRRDGSLLVVAVGAPGARDVVRARLAGAGLREGDEYVCAA